MPPTLEEADRPEGAGGSAGAKVRAAVYRPVADADLLQITGVLVLAAEVPRAFSDAN
jgi:hypothetical protein